MIEIGLAAMFVIGAIVGAVTAYGSRACLPRLAAPARSNGPSANGYGSELRLPALGALLRGREAKD